MKTVHKFEETNRLSVDEITNKQKLIELPFFDRIKIQLFQSLRQNEPFIRETTDDKSLQIEKIKISKIE